VSKELGEQGNKENGVEHGLWDVRDTVVPCNRSIWLRKETWRSPLTTSSEWQCYDVFLHRHRPRYDLTSTLRPALGPALLLVYPDPDRPSQNRIHVLVM
jgi:hypothetical protein